MSEPRKTRPRRPQPLQPPAQPPASPQGPGWQPASPEGPVPPRYPPAADPQPASPGYPPAYPPGYPSPEYAPQPAYPQPARPPAQPPAQRPPQGAPPPGYYRVPPRAAPPRRPRRRAPRFRFRLGCLLPILAAMLGLLVVALYLLAPGRINLMILGIDYVDPANPVAVGRSDTLMMVSIDPPSGSVGLISIPRDLWVSIPGVGENRINTAHFFAESAVPGSGPEAVRQTIKQNFGVDLPYYVRFRFEAFREIVDAMGGVDITLDEPTAGYPAGRHHLTGRKALAFVRDRANSDDFFRMQQGQLMIKAMLRNLLNPLKWFRLPAVARAFFGSLDTNLPVWQWPRAGLAVLRAGPSGIDSHTINREMTTGFTTNEGAMVLAPNWELIRPLVKQVFHLK